MFGDKLKELRKEHNLSQAELGKILGVTNTAVYSWEISRTQPPLEVIMKIADIFKVSTDYLLGLNSDNLDEMDKLKKALREAGMMTGDDLTKEELKKAMQIVEMLRNKNE